MKLYRNKKAPVVRGHLSVSAGRLCKRLYYPLLGSNFDKQSTLLKTVAFRQPVKEVMIEDLSTYVG